MESNLSKSIFLAASVLTSATVLAQGTWTGCNPVADGEIKVTPIVQRTPDDIQEPIKLAF